MIALSPASAAVECAGGQHRLLWRDGKLTAADHPDAERERALTALGAESYRCLDLLRVWEQHTEDLDVLLLSRRGPRDRLAPHTEHPHPGVLRGRAVGWTSYRPLSSTMSYRSVEDGDVAARLADVLGLGGGLPDRLAAQVIWVWTGRIADGDSAVGSVLPRLHAALYGRFAAAVRDWLGAPDLRVDLTMTPPGSTGAVSLNSGRLQARLPFSWLADVWLPGFAVIAERLCLAAAGPQPNRFELSTVDRSLTEPATVTLEVHSP